MTVIKTMCCDWCGRSEPFTQRAQADESGHGWYALTVERHPYGAVHDTPLAAFKTGRSSEDLCDECFEVLVIEIERIRPLRRANDLS